MAELQFTGTVMGTEVASKGPHKVLIAAEDKPDFNKTFRVWGTIRDGDGNDIRNPAWAYLQGANGQKVTVNFTEEQRPGPQGTYKQNLIRSVVGQSAAQSAPQSAPAASPAAPSISDAEWRRFASLVASEVVLQLRNAGAVGQVPEEGQPPAKDNPEPPLPSEIYDDFATQAEQEGYGEKVLERKFNKLFPDQAFHGWRHATAEGLQALATDLELAWK